MGPHLWGKISCAEICDYSPYEIEHSSLFDNRCTYWYSRPWAQRHSSFAAARASSYDDGTRDVDHLRRVDAHAFGSDPRRGVFRRPGAFGARVEPEEEAQALESRRRARAEASTSADVSPPPPLPARRNAKCVECSAAPFVPQVENLYLRGRADPVALAPDVAFEDPAALVEAHEVREAFRALRARPALTRPPRWRRSTRGDTSCVRRCVTPFLTSPDGLVVRSDVLVTLAERDGKIERLEERWNG